jgi:plastocyanin
MVGSNSATHVRIRGALRWSIQAAALGAAVAVLGGCGSSPGTSPVAASAHKSTAAVTKSSASGSSAQAGSRARTENVSLIGKIDADSGAPGTFTGKEDWPALTPNTIHVKAGARVTLTIKEYDDMVTALPQGSPYNKVTGGTETVDGKRVTVVGNKEIAHTVTIPGLGINIPLPKAPEHGYTTITFTFTAPAAGTYQWQCMTPCGAGPQGVGGAMQTEGWMRGRLVVA